MKIFSLTLFFTLLLFGNVLAKGKRIKPTNDKINYVGRFEFTDSLEPKCSYPYSSIEARFFGQYLSVTFTEYGIGGDEHTNYVEVIIDKRPVKTLKLESGTHDYSISDELGINYHTVRFVKRTEASVGMIGFNGMRVEEKKLVEIKEKKINLMVVGGAWSTGYGNEVKLWSDISCGFHSKNQDANVTWGSLISETYRANLHNISCADAAVSRGFDGSPGYTMLDRLDLIPPSDTSKKWNHKDYQPDVIYVYLGSTDFAPEFATTPNMLDSSSYVSNYLKLISKLTDDYPKAFILCICGGSKNNHYPKKIRQLDRWKMYTKAVVNIMGFLEKPVFYKELSGARRPWGEDWYPTKIIHRRIAFEIKDYFPLIR